MPATKQQITDRELAIKALNDFKSTHTLKEIAAKTSIPLSRLEHYLYKYKHKLNLPFKNLELKRGENFYEMALFHQYRRANFEVTPLFLIRTHNITQATAARICNKLKELK